jgi:hypothetical protein
MFKPLSICIGLRYTAAKRRNHFISFISLTSMIGLMLGVAVLIIVLSVMNGFDRELKQRILGMVPHAVIEGVNGIDDWRAVKQAVLTHPHVLAAAPFIQGQGMVTGGGEVRGVLINGVLPDQERTVSIIEDHMVEGSLDDLKPGEFGIIVGRLLAASLRLQVGDRVTVVLPEASVLPVDLLIGQDVGILLLAVAVEGAELAVDPADVGVVDVAVDHEGGDPFGVKFPFPLGGHAAQVEKVGFTDEPEGLLLGESLHASSFRHVAAAALLLFGDCVEHAVDEFGRLLRPERLGDFDRLVDDDRRVEISEKNLIGAQTQRRAFDGTQTVKIPLFKVGFDRLVDGLQMVHHPSEQGHGKLFLFVADLFVLQNLVGELGDAPVTQVVGVEQTHNRHAGVVTCRHYASISL